MKIDIFSVLKENVETSKKINKRISQFLLDYEGDYRTLKITEITEDTLTSNASVVRFAKSLGYNGFPELKLVLANEVLLLSGGEHLLEAKVNPHIYTQQIVSSFEKTIDLNNNQQLLKVTNLIKNSDKVDVFGVGETNVIAKDFSLKLIRIGKTSTSFEDVHTQHFISSNSTNKTVALGISFSGTTAETLNALKNAKKYGAQTILIAKKGVKKPSYIDILLVVDACESSARVFSTLSRFSLLYLLDLIYLELIQLDNEQISNKLKDTRIKRSK